jgi:hypothetical protein
MNDFSALQQKLLNFRNERDGADSNDGRKIMGSFHVEYLSPHVWSNKIFEKAVHP